MALCACMRRWRRTTLDASPALLMHHTRPERTALVVLDAALHAWNVWCSRSSSISTRLDVLPRVLRLFAVATL